MDLFGLFLIVVVLLFGSGYVVWTLWAVWREARIGKAKADGQAVAASTWSQHGSTLLASVVFLSVATSLCVSIARDKSSVKAIEQWRLLTGSTWTTEGKTWGRKGCQGSLHVTVSSGEESVTGASLAYIDFDDADLRELLEQHPRIEWLILSGTRIDDQALKLLARRENLVALVVANTSITDGGLANFRGHRQLRELDLTHTVVTDQCLQTASSLPALRHLSVCRTNVTDNGLENLKGNLQLRSLDLEWTQISDAAVPTLASLKNLKSLYVRNCRLSPDAIGRLREALPRCTVHSRSR